MADAINPAHYQGLFETRDMQCIALSRCLDFCLGNWAKYIYRLGNKDDALQDFNKARWYMEDWFAHHEGITPYISVVHTTSGSSMWAFSERKYIPINNPFAEKARIAFEFIKPPNQDNEELYARYELLKLVTDDYIIPEYWRYKMGCYAIQYLGEENHK